MANDDAEELGKLRDAIASVCKETEDVRSLALDWLNYDLFDHHGKHTGKIAAAEALAGYYLERGESADLLVAALVVGPYDAKAWELADSHPLTKAQRVLPELLHDLKPEAYKLREFAADCFNARLKADLRLAPQARHWGDEYRVLDHAFTLARDNDPNTLLGYVQDLLSKHYLDSLNRWLLKSIDLLRVTMPPPEERAPAGAAANYLLIEVATADPGVSYRLRFWVVDEKGKDPGLGVLHLTAPPSPLSRDEIAGAIRLLRDQVIAAGVASESLQVEVFLPRDLMVLEKADDWKAPDEWELVDTVPNMTRPIGLIHAVVIRSTERIDVIARPERSVLDRQLRERVFARWKAIKETAPICGAVDKGPGKGKPGYDAVWADPTRLRPADLREHLDANGVERVACCLLLQPPAGDDLAVALGVGLPILVWHRKKVEAEKTPGVRKQLCELVTANSLRSLPGHARTVRKKARTARRLLNVGLALSLFYDDPNRLPPDRDDLSMFREATRREATT